jgi:hypothetical protein
MMCAVAWQALPGRETLQLAIAAYGESLPNVSGLAVARVKLEMHGDRPAARVQA